MMMFSAFTPNYFQGVPHSPVWNVLGSLVVFVKPGAEPSWSSFHSPSQGQSRQVSICLQSIGTKVVEQFLTEWLLWVALDTLCHQGLVMVSDGAYQLRICSCR